VPASAAEGGLQRHEQSIVGQPAGVALAKRREAGLLLHAGVREKMIIAAAQQTLLVLDHSAEIHPV
jgi:hypothetical protein